MARNFTIIRRAIWSDPEFLQLTQGAQWLYLMRRTQNQATRFIPQEAASYAADCTEEQVIECARELADTRFGYILNKKSQRRAVSPSVRLQVFSDDGFSCVWCGSTDRLELDHIVPVSKGGTNERTNLQTLCYTHNRKKGAKLDGPQTND